MTNQENKTKYVILLGDGMPGKPVPELDNKTTLQAARTPNMDWIAKEGTTGMIQTIPAGFPPGSDVSQMNILGYRPQDYFTGRAPLEAASMGVKLEPNDVAFRCNLVTLHAAANGIFMRDYSGDHIPTEEAKELIEYLDKETGSEEFKFYPGVSYRHLLVWKNGVQGTKLTPPHDITGANIKDFLPQGDGAEPLTELISHSQMFLKNHPRTVKLQSEGKHPANSIWLWGQGKAPQMPKFSDRFGISGAMISAVDLMRGIGVYAGFEIIYVPGATGYFDTNYRGKADYALKALEEKDLVYVHVESPDEGGHIGDAEKKVKAIEDFDEKVIGPILKGIKKYDDYRILLLSDHATPVELMTHVDDPVPFAIYPNISGTAGSYSFDERISENPSVRFDHGEKLIEYFMDRQPVS